MCLREKFSIIDRKAITDKIGSDGIKVYKVVGVGDGYYSSAFVPNQQMFDEGVNGADTSHQIEIHGGSYKSGFHLFKNRADAKHRLDDMNKLLETQRRFQLDRAAELGVETFDEYRVITCTVKKSWITMIGKDIKDSNHKLATSIIAKKAIFPKFRK